GNVSECAVTVVVKERRARRFLFALQSGEGRTVDQINIEPAVVVVIEERHASRRRFEDEAFVSDARDVAELFQSRPRGNVGEVNWRAVHEGAGGDGARAGVFDGFESSRGARAALCLLLLCLGISPHREQGYKGI